MYEVTLNLLKNDMEIDHNLFSHFVKDGKVHKAQETIESIDEQDKTINFKLFGGDINQQYKSFKLILQVIDKNDGGAAVKWTIEYEKINEDIDPPHGYMDYFDKSTKEMDAYVFNT
ncbi:kirola-like [Cajanus cajan]|uniref:kirola-like n=1 Tax=Cajanus cajan TaxID=3821 RepID=UPI0010FB853B|nr:kirola-like [Cajanus cajan]